MKLKLLALALSALPLCAFAEITLYGTLQGSVGRTTQSNAPTLNQVGDTGSRLGIKGTENLSDGLKAIWQIESKVHLDGHAQDKTTLGSRETFVGLEDSAFGKLRIGYLNSPRKDMYTVDQWKYAGHIRKNRDNDVEQHHSGVNGLAVLTNQSKRLKNAIRYDSPTVAGFSGSLAYGFGENKSGTDGNNSTVQYASDIFALGVNYQYGPGFIRYAYDQEANPNAIKTDGSKLSTSAQTGNTIQKARIHYVEAGYKDEQWLVAAAYQQAYGYDWTDGFSGDSKANFGNATTPVSSAQAKLRTRQMALSAAYTTGLFTPKLSLAKGWDQQVNGQRLEHSGYRQFVAGLDYQLSKRTVTGVSYGRLTFDQNAHAAIDASKTSLSSWAFNLIHRF